MMKKTVPMKVAKTTMAMKKEHRIFFRGVPKSIRKLLCLRDQPRAIMEHSVPKPKSIRIGNTIYKYDSI